MDIVTPFDILSIFTLPQTFLHLANQRRMSEPTPAMRFRTSSVYAYPEAHIRTITTRIQRLRRNYSIVCLIQWM